MFVLFVCCSLTHCIIVITDISRPVSLSTVSSQNALLFIHHYNSHVVIAALCIWRTLCMWRLVHQWSFLLVWLSFDCFWLFLTIGTVYQSSKNSQKIVKTAKMTIGVPIITCLPRLYQQCTNRQKQSKAVKNCQKQSKDSQNSKKWCTNRQRSTKTVPTVYQLSKTVKRQSKDQNDHSCTNHHMFTQSPPNTHSPRPHPRPPNTQSRYR